MRGLAATDLRGCIVALATPMAEGRLKPEINYSVVNQLMNHVLRGNVSGVVVSGCTGAAYGLSVDEQIALNRFVNEHYGRDTRIIAGDGSNCTWEAIEMAKRIEGEAGIFNHLIISPYYNKPSSSGLIKHYTAIAKDIEGNIILYSVPSRTGGKGITLDVIKELWQHPQIIGIKDSSSGLERTTQILENTHWKQFSILSGDDDMAFERMKLGARGHVSTAGNIVPKPMANMINYALVQRYAEAEEINQSLMPLYAALFPKDDQQNPSPNPSTTHFALRRIGIDAGIPRLPLSDCSEEEKSSIEAALDKLGCLQ
jgi:4-hydroxy-tetrahydrodipicolinate synthase